MARRSRRVSVLSAGADPRVDPAASQASTTAGESGRLLTLLEGRPFVGSAAGAFERTVTDGGWLGREPDERSRWWAHARRAAAMDARAVAETTDWYALASARALDLWSRAARDDAHLFDGASLYQGAITRLYDSPPVASTAARQHQDRGVLVRHIEDAASLKAQVPLAESSIGAGTVRAAVVTRGMSLDIRRFVANLIEHLEGLEVTFSWNTRVTGLRWHDGERLSAVQTPAGEVAARDVILAPGAYSPPSLLEPLGGRITGVAGRWLLMPRPPGWAGPLKLHLTPEGQGVAGPALDLNFMAYHDQARDRDALAVGGGYIHVGGPPFATDPAQLARVDAQIASAVERLWPEWWRRCDREGAIVRSSALCVRSFTTDDRPAFINRPTTLGGRFVVHAGLNTGTATMAPAIAEAIADVLEGSRESAGMLHPNPATAAGCSPILPGALEARVTTTSPGAFA